MQGYALFSLYFIREQRRTECDVPPLRTSKKFLHLRSLTIAPLPMGRVRYSGEFPPSFRFGGFKDEVRRETES